MTIRRKCFALAGFWAVTMGAAAIAQAQYAETVLYNFVGQSEGVSPAGLVRDSAGNLYGTTYGGGTGLLPYGVLYKIDPSGNFTVLYNFSEEPPSGLAIDSAGNLYGTTSGFGSFFAGTIWKVTPAAQYTVLYTFSGGADGAYPVGNLTLDSAGNLYGATQGGGDGGYTDGLGVLYELDTTGHQTVLYTFPGAGHFSNSPRPNSALALDLAGNLYGTRGAGRGSRAEVYKLDTARNLTVLYSFGSASHGSNPSSGVILDSAGNLYGTTTAGGKANVGVVYKVDTTGQETVLYSFKGGRDGSNPYGGLILDEAGNLYGTTESGGTGNHGVVYKVDSSGTETVLYRFTGASGATPVAGVVRDPEGNLYGTTSSGTPANLGLVYKLDVSGSEKVLHAFTGGKLGGYTTSPVVVDAAGNVYGTSPSGGRENNGVLYKLDPTGNPTVLHNFTSADGIAPGSLVLDSSGSLFGYTSCSCSQNYGTLFEFSAGGEFSVLYTFTGHADGAYPAGGIVVDSADNLYGTTEYTLYKLNTLGQLTVLHTFSGEGDDGGLPSGVTMDSAGNLYGTDREGGTNSGGVLYEFTAGGQFTVLYNFVSSLGSGYPSQPIVDSAGDLYGTLGTGSAADPATVYQFNAAAQFTVLYAYNQLTCDDQTFGTLTRDASGNLYGATSSSPCDAGFVYRLDTSGNLTTLYTFATGGYYGAEPTTGALALDPAGNLYGTTEFEGAEGAGVVFKLSPHN
jgi:uncharacterized repeat protein (TIGR03803 family)